MHGIFIRRRSIAAAARAARFYGHAMSPPLALATICRHLERILMAAGIWKLRRIEAGRAES